MEDKIIIDYECITKSATALEVININNGKRLGFVQDVCADLDTGKITHIIVPGSNKLMNIFSSNNEIVISWEDIKCIGDDLILVEI